MTSQSNDNTYYVNEYGVRAKNQWISVENEDSEDVNGNEVDTLWYYFGDNGKAYKAENGDSLQKKTVPDSTGSRTYFFDSEGHMVSDWVEYDGSIYYCGTENEGWAYTGWQYLEPDEDKNSENYDDQEWFNFKSSGKARTSATWYSKGRYYTFDENGVMTSDWYDLEVASNTLGVATGTNGGENAYTSEYGSKGTGWVYTENAEESDSYWYYLVSFTGKDKNDKTVTMRNIPFNSQSGDGKMRAKVIKSKTYIFNDKGEMQDGLVTLTTNTPADNKGGAISKELKAGTYYFNEGNGSVNGQMVTGKTTVEDDGETYYYFDKSTGRALTDTVKDGIVYGHDGDRIDAEDGNTNAVIDNLEADILYKNGEYILKDSRIVVSSSGKLRTSGTVKVDGIYYEIKKDTTSKTDVLDANGKKIGVGYTWIADSNISKNN